MKGFESLVEAARERSKDKGYGAVASILTYKTGRRRMAILSGKEPLVNVAAKGDLIVILALFKRGELCGQPKGGIKLPPTYLDYVQRQNHS